MLAYDRSHPRSVCLAPQQLHVVLHSNAAWGLVRPRKAEAQNRADGACLRRSQHPTSGTDRARRSAATYLPEAGAAQGSIAGHSRRSAQARPPASAGWAWVRGRTAGGVDEVREVHSARRTAADSQHSAAPAPRSAAASEAAARGARRGVRRAPRTDRTRLVPPPVLIGHAASASTRPPASVG